MTMLTRFSFCRAMAHAAALLLLLSAPVRDAAAQPASGKHAVKAIGIPLADHYAAVVAYEKYAPEMRHADYQLEILPGPELVRARFRDDDVDMAFNVCPMVMDMFAKRPDFRWVGLLYRDGNALAINELLNMHVQLPDDRKARKPDSKVADAYMKVKEAQGKPSECAVLPHPLQASLPVLRSPPVRLHEHPSADLVPVPHPDLHEWP